MKELHDAPMPAEWSSYLINGDCSGIEDIDQEDCDTYLEQQGIEEVFLDREEEPYFSWSYGFYGGTERGGDLLNYKVTLK